MSRLTLVATASEPLKDRVADLYSGRDFMCPRCKTIKPHTFENFRACEEDRGPHGYRYTKRVCRDCEINDRIKYRRANADRENARRRAAGKYEFNRRENLKRKFGITPETYDLMLSAQGGRCAICAEKNEGPRAFAVDHNHQTGKVRGLLCHNCNIGLGNLKDSKHLLLLAIKYLEDRDG